MYIKAIDKARLFRVARRTLLATLIAATFNVAHAADEIKVDIAAQPLSSALTKFAEQSGIKVQIPAALLAGKNAPRIEGNLSPRQALDKLLSGSGLRYQFVSTDAVKIDAASAANVTRMSTIEVQDAAEKGYTAKRASSGTKTEVAIHETPVSIQVIPREVMDDQQVIGVKDATKNVSSVLPSTYQFYEAYTIRGFDTGTDVYRNGLRQPSFSDQQTANVEQVEVLKGPAAILYGRIQPGGMVNVVTKRPRAQPYYSLQQQVGTYDLYRTTADATGPVTDDGAMMYRVNFAYQTNESFVDFLSNKNTFIAPSLTWRPSNRFELNLELEYQRREYVHFGTNGGGVPAIGNRPANLPRSRYIGNPSIAVNFPNEQNRDFAGFDGNYAINDNWNLKHRFGYTAVDYLTHYAGARALNETTGILTQSLQGAFQDRKSYATNLDLSGKFSTGEIHHQLLLGIDYFGLKQNYHGLGLSPIVIPLPSIDIFNPVYSDISTLVNSTPDNSYFIRKEYWTGIYFQDQMRVGEKWHLLAGGRFDDASHGTGSNYVIGGSLENAWKALVLRNDKAFSPRLGLLFQPAPWLSVYGNYVGSFGTNNGVSATGEAFDPQKAKQYEAGTKSELLDGKLTATVALFEITKTNVLTRDPNNPNFSIPIGEARSRGVEFDVSGRIGRNWSVISNFTYDRAEITKDNRGNQGKILPGVPGRSGSIWAKYDTGNATEGLSFGAGIFLRGQRQGDTPNTFQLPGYGRVDALLAYRFKAFGGKLMTAQINVQNLLDKTYFDHGGSGGTRLNTYYGEPRTITGSLRIQF
ncbi:MAG: TonB-dependent receptor [Betaproteobacteria bacterium]|nr:TonB-dependent receptor [Betaproteobacteria bacterium]